MMRLTESLRFWGPRLMLSLASAFSISATALVCAWYQYRSDLRLGLEDDSSVSFWEFAVEMHMPDVKLTCLLAGALAFPLCMYYSTALDGKRSSLVKVLIANTLTALFAILTAVVMAGLHLPFDHH